MLGDAGIPDSGSDENYTGDVSTSAVSMDYVRNKGREFQSMLNGLDEANGAILLALDAGVDEETENDLLVLLDEFDGKRSMLRATLEAFNLGAATVNAIGGRLPKLSIPSTLGFAPLAIPASMLVALAGVAAAVSWGVVWLMGVNERLATAQLLDAQDTPEGRAALARAQSKARDAQNLVSQNPIAAIAGVVKWAALAALGYMAYRAYSTSQKAG